MSTVSCIATSLHSLILIGMRANVSLEPRTPQEGAYCRREFLPSRNRIAPRSHCTVTQCSAKQCTPKNPNGSGTRIGNPG
jgi:hypothetical protein